MRVPASRKSAAVTRICGFDVTCVESNLPCAVGLPLPNREVTAGGYDGIPVLIFRVPFIVAPGEAHVAGLAHPSAFRRPRKLVLRGQPGCLLRNRRSPDHRSLSVGQRHRVVGEEGGESFSSAGGSRMSKFRFEPEKKCAPRRKRWIAQRIASGRLPRKGVQRNLRAQIVDARKYLRTGAERSEAAGSGQKQKQKARSHDSEILRDGENALRILSMLPERASRSSQRCSSKCS
jgi:hypothetical protein